MNLAWILVGSVSGCTLGRLQAYVTVGGNVYRQMGALAEAAVVRGAIGAIVGALVGVALAWQRSGRYPFLLPRYSRVPWHRKLPAEVVVWPLLAVTVVWLYFVSPAFEMPAE
jgi:hypothetical protein